MAMDIAQQIELSVLERQKPMNAVIDRGDSDVQQFYRDSTVLVTGGSGFLGKQLIEKLTRSCDIKKIYLLLRPKKGKTIEQRLAYILKDPLYDTLRTKKPNFAARIVPVDGDIAELRIGLSEKDWNSITNEVNVIIHMAATVNFDEPLHVAGLINVRGTREMITLAKQCRHLKLFSHISTAFAHATKTRIDTDINEQFYPCPIPPDVFLGLVDSVDQDRFASITPALVKDWPNTYTFTKAIAEELVRTIAGDLPICIVKPPVVINSFVEPPGWVDHQTVMSSPMGLFLGVGLGVLHVILADKELVVSYAPVDYVNNAVIAAGWDSVQNRQQWGGDIPMYTVSSSPYNTKWGDLTGTFQHDDFYRLSSPKTLWYGYIIETNNVLVYWLLTWFLHYIPGYILDAVVSILGVRPKGVPSFLFATSKLKKRLKNLVFRDYVKHVLTKIYGKVYKLTMVYRYFMSNYWNFRDNNLCGMISRLSPADRAIYNCDISQIPVRELLESGCVGGRRFIYKDGLTGSDIGYRKQKWLFYANIIFISLYLYCIWRLVTMICSSMAVLFNV